MKPIPLLILAGIATTLLLTAADRPIPPAVPHRADASLRRKAAHGDLQVEEQRSAHAATEIAKALWEAQEFPGSPTVVAKKSTMLQPLDSRGHILQTDILSYWDASDGKLRYATNVFDRAVSR